jgi:hypothetical protein
MISWPLHIGKMALFKMLLSLLTIGASIPILPNPALVALSHGVKDMGPTSVQSNREATGSSRSLGDGQGYLNQSSGKVSNRWQAVFRNNLRCAGLSIFDCR